MAEPSYEELRVRLKETEQKLESRELKLRELGVDDWEPKPVAPEAPVVIKTCNHIRENGAFCQSVALRGREYCRFHLRERGRRLKMARARARGERWHLDLPPLEDLYAVQVSIMRVLQALDQAATNLRCPQGLGALLPPSSWPTARASRNMTTSKPSTTCPRVST